MIERGASGPASGACTCAVVRVPLPATRPQFVPKKCLWPDRICPEAIRSYGCRRAATRSSSSVNRAVMWAIARRNCLSTARVDIPSSSAICL